MTFEQFVEHCSFDAVEEDGQTKIICIFSAGFIREFSNGFVDGHEDFAHKLTAHDLYDYLSNMEENTNG